MEILHDDSDIYTAKSIADMHGSRQMVVDRYLQDRSEFYHQILGPAMILLELAHRTIKPLTSRLGLPTGNEYYCFPATIWLPNVRYVPGGFDPEPANGFTIFDHSGSCRVLLPTFFQFLHQSMGKTFNLEKLKSQPWTADVTLLNIYCHEGDGIFLDDIDQDRIPEANPTYLTNLQFLPVPIRA